MHIYIYGSAGFKAAIHKALDHANVKFRMDENGTIEDITSLEALKMAIEEEPNNIYLIDQDKIIYEKSLNSKIGFLKPKDGIEKKFLDEHGIEDVSIDSIDDLPRYVIKKLESMNLTDIFDEEDEKKSTSVSEEEIDEINNILTDIENDENDDEDFDIDDDLKGFLTHDDDSDEADDENIDEEKPETDQLLNLDLEEVQNVAFEEASETSEDTETEEEINDMQSLMDIDIDDQKTEETQDLNSLMDIDIPEEEIHEIDDNQESEESEEIQQTQGETNMDDLTQLDQLQEEDLMNALNDLEMITPAKPVSPAPAQTTITPASTSGNNIELNGSNIGDIQALITQLLNNKTLEITIKIKE